MACNFDACQQSTLTALDQRATCYLRRVEQIPMGGWFSLNVNHPTSSAGRSGSRSMFLGGLVPELLICAESSQTLCSEGMRLIDLVSCNHSGEGQDYRRLRPLMFPDRISRWFTTFPQAVPASATHTSHEFNDPVIW